MRFQVGQVYEGVVERYDPAKGFGFIQCAEGAEVFFHVTAWQERPPRKPRGLKVRFELATKRVEGKDKNRAEKVEVLS
jgi:cold shock CspA family protein